MARHGLRRARASELVPGTVSAIMVTLDYAPDDPQWLERAWAGLDEAERGYVSRYALGRDYHKVVRSRLQRLATRIEAHDGPFGYRVFCDSGPVMEVELAARAGLGWRGKNTLLLSRERGSMFFLGTLLTDLPPPPARATSAHCGSCTRCIDALSHGRDRRALPARRRRCISYLTIELPGRSRSRCARRSATASMAATTASSRARGTALPGRRLCPISRRATGSTPARWSICSAGAARSSSSGCRARRSGASGTNDGLRNIAVALGNGPASDQARGAPARSARARSRRGPDGSSRRSRRAPTTPRRWFASTWPGRAPGTASVARTDFDRSAAMRRTRSCAGVRASRPGPGLADPDRPEAVGRLLRPVSVPRLPQHLVERVRLAMDQQLELAVGLQAVERFDRAFEGFRRLQEARVDFDDLAVGRTPGRGTESGIGSSGAFHVADLHRAPVHARSAGRRRACAARATAFPGSGSAARPRCAWTSAATPGLRVVLALAAQIEQIADQALRGRAHAVGLDVRHELVQPRARPPSMRRAKSGIRDSIASNTGFRGTCSSRLSARHAAWTG